MQDYYVVAGVNTVGVATYGKFAVAVNPVFFTVQTPGVASLIVPRLGPATPEPPPVAVVVADAGVEAVVVTTEYPLGTSPPDNKEVRSPQDATALLLTMPVTLAA